MYSSYNEISYEISCENKVILEALLHSDLALKSHYLYEKIDTIYIAFGSLCEIEAYTDREVVIIDNRTGSKKLFKDLDIIKSVQQATQEIQMKGWQAFGFANFELSYLIHDISFSPTKRTLLLKLTVPEVLFELSENSVLVKISYDLTERNHANILKTIEDLFFHLANHKSTKSSENIGIDLTDDGSYEKSVANAVMAINEKSFLKVILSRRIYLPKQIDLHRTYLNGFGELQYARSFLISDDSIQAVGFSPEIVVSVDCEGKVVTQPLAGTRMVGENIVENNILQSVLREDLKEIAEHAMSVQLAFSELEQCCNKESVVVERYMDILERGTVQHLASRLSGQLDLNNATCWDAFKALFPAVTASGINKRASIEYIKANEIFNRSLYSGSVMILDHKGSLDAALVLRSVFKSPTESWLQAGAGIVSSSLPEREFIETCEKLSSISKFVTYESI